MRISDWSSDVCSSDLRRPHRAEMSHAAHQAIARRRLSPPTKNINRCGARPRLVILGDDAIIRAVLRVAIPMLRSERPVLIVQNAFRRTGNIFILTAFQPPEDKRSEKSSVGKGGA